MIHDVQNIHSDDNFRKPDSEKISQSSKEIFDDEFRMFEEKAQQGVQIKDYDHEESNLVHSNQSFRDICNEDLRIFEEIERMMISRCCDSYLEPFIKECAPSVSYTCGEATWLELLVDNFEINMIHSMSKIHINEDPMN